MTTNTVKIKRISSSTRKDPLNDLNTLSQIGRSATRHARKRAFDNGSSITFAENGTVYRMQPNGAKEVIRVIEEQSSFPTLEEDLCQA